VSLTSSSGIDAATTYRGEVRWKSMKKSLEIRQPSLTISGVRMLKVHVPNDG